MVTVSQLRKRYEHPIRKLLKGSFEHDLLTAALDNLSNGGPLRFNNFSYALRELLRHVLHRLAPDGEVTACVWFKPDKTALGGITRAHRATYAIQGGLSDAFVNKKLAIDIVPVRSRLLRAIEVLNKHTHIEPSTFGMKAQQALPLAEKCLKATQYFTSHIAKCRARVARSLSRAIDEHLLDMVIAETIDSIDELATHHRVDDIDVHEVEVMEIGSKTVLVCAEGSIGCELQYGSNSDVENDIGVVTADSFPFTSHLTVALERPLGKVASVDQFHVDTRSWYE